VEYVYYLMIILGMIAVCLYQMHRSRDPNAGVVRLSHRKPDRVNSGKADSDAPKALENQKAVLQREIAHVPTPWGWPGYQPNQKANAHGGKHEAHGVSDSLQRWIDHLTSEKRTINDEEFRAKQNACIRALLEDRFGRPSAGREIKYRQTGRLLLRDPSQPHDQMDNFPSGRLNKIESKLEAQPESARVTSALNRTIRYEGLKEVRTPWGW
jgi:hypothetical protein